MIHRLDVEFFSFFLEALKTEIVNKLTMLQAWAEWH